MGGDGDRSAIGARLQAPPLGADELDRARFGFHKAHPHLSARRTLYVTQLLALLAIVAGLYFAWSTAPQTTFSAFHVLALSLFAAAIFWRLFAAASLAPLQASVLAPADSPMYTLLCPLYREANVVGELIAAINRLDYPKHQLDVKLLIEEDDEATKNAALALAMEPHFEVLVIPPAAPRTKPKALNIGLARARGVYVGVYDAEDRPHPQQLRAALAAFEAGGESLVCVQAPLVIDNAGAAWIARQFAAEYAIQFAQILPLLARLGLPMPLGGSSNHFRTDALRAAGGWDAFNVTEDADLGYRLARIGLRCGLIAPPTSEEAPVTIGAWFNQRTRWLKGHMLTWLVLMRDPVRTAREMGLAAFLSMQLVLATGVLAAFAHGPLACVLLAAALTPYDLLGPADLVLAVSGYSVGAFAALTACALSGNLSHARAAFTMPLYWPLASLAAARALFELIARPHYWSKTEHGLSRRAEIGVQRNAFNNAHMTPTSASA
ncbi:MAG: glycosyltransferase [Terricaulis sp.]